MVLDWNDRQLRWMHHFPPHAHVDEMTNTEQQWGMATTSFYDNAFNVIILFLSHISFGKNIYAYVRASGNCTNIA